MIIELCMDQGAYAEAIRHYLRLVNYVLVDPPAPGAEEKLVTGYLLRELRYVQEDLGYESPANTKSGDGNFVLAACLGSEAIIGHYRREKDFHGAARFAGDCSNWRHWEKRLIDKYAGVFRQARKEVPAEFWEYIGSV